MCTVGLQTDDVWRRAAPAPLLASSSASVTIASERLTAPASATLTAPRIGWTTGGFTVRVRWLYSDNDCTFFEAEAGANDVKAYYKASDNKLYIEDSAGAAATSGALTSSAGDELDLVFKWDPATPKKGIWVNGVANGSAGACTLTFTLPETYKIFAPSTVSQTLVSWQLWPAVLTDAQCAGLYSWGQPEAELPFYVTPTDTKNTNGLFKVYNVPGTTSAPVRLVVEAGQALDKLLVAARPGRVQTAAKLELESGTLGTAVTSEADATASAGNVARFTPTTTGSVLRVTSTIATNPAEIAAYKGRYRLYMQLKDNNTAVGRAKIKFRLVAGGVNGDFSDLVYAAALSTYSLVDLGTFFVPPDAWPENAENATTTEVTPALKVEIWAENTSGGGGDTLDMDALQLVPDEVALEAQGAAWAYATQYAVLDFCSMPPAHVLVADWRSLEFGGWLEVTGSWLELSPGPNTLWVYGFRTVTEGAQANDTLTAVWLLAPGWK